MLTQVINYVLVILRLPGPGLRAPSTDSVISVDRLIKQTTTQLVYKPINRSTDQSVGWSVIQYLSLCTFVTLVVSGSLLSETLARVCRTPAHPLKTNGTCLVNILTGLWHHTFKSYPKKTEWFVIQRSGSARCRSVRQKLYRRRRGYLESERLQQSHGIIVQFHEPGITKGVKEPLEVLGVCMWTNEVVVHVTIQLLTRSLAVDRSLDQSIDRWVSQLKRSTDRLASDHTGYSARLNWLPGDYSGSCLILTSLTPETTWPTYPTSCWKLGDILEDRQKTFSLFRRYSDENKDRLANEHTHASTRTHTPARTNTYTTYWSNDPLLTLYERQETPLYVVFWSHARLATSTRQLGQIA